MRESNIRWRPVYAAACLLATVQFIWLYLSRMREELNLAAYEHGMERTPFQYRILLAAPLRWAHGSTVLQHWAAALTKVPLWFPGGVLPESFVEAPIDFASVLLAAACAHRLYLRGSRQPRLGWMVWPLVVWLCFLTYGAETHHALRFPYDLPAMALFAWALYLMHAGGRIWLLYAVFAAATLNRETTLLLLPFFFLAERSRKTSLWTMCFRAMPMILLWTTEQALMAHRFRANPAAAGPRFLLNLESLLLPLSWPQALGALGFLWPFLYLFRRSIPDPVLRAWLHGYWIWFAFMCVFGLLLEPRIFGELIPLTACLGVLMFEERLAAGLPANAEVPT